MKAKFFLIALSAMMLFAVQAYAQRGERHEGRSRSNARVEHRSSRPATRSSSVARPAQTRRSSAVSRNQSDARRSSTPQNRGTERRSSATTSRSSTHRNAAVAPRRSESHSVAPRSANRQHGRATSRNRSYDRRPAAPRHAPHRHYEPVFHHHHGYYHHSYHCRFNDWYWYTWGGYSNRFICHRLYRDRFFDNLLGYYLWGAINAPTRLDIGDITFTRYNETLKVRNGYDTSYLDLYRYQTVRYISGYTTVDVSTGGGFADIRFYDEYGNEANYRL